MCKTVTTPFAIYCRVKDEKIVHMQLRGDLYGGGAFVFAFHGYQRAVHEIIHGQPNVERFHVREFKEQATTTTPFDMVALNGISRYHLAMEAMWRAPRMQARWESLVALCEETLRNAMAYSVEHMEDRPDIRDWMWTED